MKPNSVDLDNHHSHIAFEVLNFAKSNHITILSFPPPGSHVLQPLDRTVFGPLKKYMSTVMDNWLRDPYNVGKVMTIHALPAMVAYAFPKAMTPTNTTSGFRCTGIYPFDRHIIKPETLLPSTVTNGPLSEQAARMTQVSSTHEIVTVHNCSQEGLSPPCTPMGPTPPQPESSPSAATQATTSNPDISTTANITQLPQLGETFWQDAQKSFAQLQAIAVDIHDSLKDNDLLHAKASVSRRTFAELLQPKDMQASQLLPADIDKSLIPVCVYGDGNCLPCALSVLAYGHEDAYIEIRARITVQMDTNEDNLLDDDHLARVSSRIFCRIHTWGSAHSSSDKENI